MAWDEDYDEGYFSEENEEMTLFEAGQEGEFLPDGLREELDYELYEQEKEESDADVFPESFEEWKLQKEHERWEHEQAVMEHDMVEQDLLENEE